MLLCGRFGASSTEVNQPAADYENPAISRNTNLQWGLKEEEAMSEHECDE